MKSNFVFISFFLFSSIRCFSQNNPPVITNITALADTIFHELVITFDVSDAENDAMEIFLSASRDGGILFNLNTSSATGDIGFPINPGAGKRIFWQYPDSLSSMIPDFVAKLAADDHSIDIQQIINQIDSNRLMQSIQFIEGIRHHTTGAQHLADVRDSLITQFQQLGLQTRLNEFPFGNLTGQNIIGKKTGLISNTKTFIVDGHYDTVDDSPGADDNGSALAGILEILRVIAPLELAYSVETIAFDLEEAGLAGSKAFVPDGIMTDEDIAGVINMDMIGYFDDHPFTQTLPDGFDLFFPDLYAQLSANQFRGNFIISTANSNSSPLLSLFDSMAVQYVPSLLVGSVELPSGIIIEDALRSDHAAFWDAGYRALHLSDGAETRNPNYHSPADASPTLNFTFMSNVTKAVTAMLLSLAKPLHADIKTVQVTPDPFSSVLETGNSDCKILLNPNPSGERLTVSVSNCGNEEMTLRIISLDGKRIVQTRFHPSMGAEVHLENIREAGYYLLEISNSKNYFSNKFFIK